MSKTNSSNNDFIISENEEDEDIKFKTGDVEEEELELRSVLKKRKKYGRSFKLSWEFDKRFSSWLIRSPNNLPFCKCCGIELKATGGTQDLKYHMKTRKHKKNLEQMKRQEAEEIKANGTFQITLVDQVVKGIELDNYEVHYPSEDEKLIKNNNLNRKQKHLTEYNKKYCKICGDQLQNNKLSCTESSNQSHIIVDNSFNIEEEKRKIQFEMRQFINELSDTNIMKTTGQAFADMLASDMCKLPDSVQRKLRMSIMQRVDEELSKVENQI